MTRSAVSWCPNAGRTQAAVLRRLANESCSSISCAKPPRTGFRLGGIRRRPDAVADGTSSNDGPRARRPSRRGRRGRHDHAQLARAETEAARARPTLAVKRLASARGRPHLGQPRSCSAARSSKRPGVPPAPASPLDLVRLWRRGLSADHSDRASPTPRISTETAPWNRADHNPAVSWGHGRVTPVCPHMAFEMQPAGVRSSPASSRTRRRALPTTRW